MRIGKLTYSFQFYKHLPEAHEIRPVGLLLDHSLIAYFQLLLAFIRNVATPELYLQSFLIDSFEEAMTQSIIGMKGCTIDGIT